MLGPSPKAGLWPVFFVGAKTQKKSDPKKFTPPKSGCWGGREVGPIPWAMGGTPSIKKSLTETKPPLKSDGAKTMPKALVFLESKWQLYFSFVSGAATPTVLPMFLVLIVQFLIDSNCNNK